MFNIDNNMPPIITHMLTELFNEKNSRNTRENYKRSVDDIRKCCELAIKTYDSQVAMLNMKTPSFKQKKR
jgi:hypothetical protein